MKCDGKHEHQQLAGGGAHAAAIYPKAVCKAICRGMRKQIDTKLADSVPTKRPGMKELSNIARESGMKKNKVEDIGIKHHWRDYVHEEEEVQAAKKSDNSYVQELKLAMQMLSFSGGDMAAWDDASGAQLDPEEVR